MSSARAAKCGQPQCIIGQPDGKDFFNILEFQRLSNREDESLRKNA
ncbi:hypothetical protein LOC71_17215 [Rhodopirellula sp. JC740]|uniref:Uncharacterized protein n=1 Tax=Rhodopirellula halodulae TaxID=2894198 RepID=A0ABS8NKE1_9BACT|nr:hypothetical protein [Rhodopirellula sp. JC740]MCC9644026.1 hypothetical protein [Rhodopirellula sp. JC740]